MSYSVNAPVMRRINRTAVLDLIRQHGPIARSEIARRLDMSLPTVMRIVDGLIAEDLAVDEGGRESSGGRPRALLAFNANAYGVIGIDLGGSKSFGAVANLSGVIEQEIFLARESRDPDANVEQLCELITQLLKAKRPRGQKIRGLGIGTPGVVLNPEGVVERAPGLGWRNLPLKQILKRRFKLPVLVENDVNLASLGEQGFGAGRGTRNLACLTVGTGVGAGIIVDGALLRGHHQAAGEVGYLPPGIEFLGRRYEQFGALESLASGAGIARRGREALMNAGGPDAETHPSAEEVFAAARRGEAWAQRIVDETVDYLSLAVAGLSCILDPEVIILGGGVSHSADLLLDPILKRLDGVTVAPPNLVLSPLGPRAAVMGAIMLVLNATTEPMSIRRFD